jgi:hypothetical protein
MTTTTKILNLIVLGLLILISFLGTFYKHISFGLGLGDILGYIVLYIGTITHLILTITSRNKGLTRHLFLVSIFLTFTILIALKATIWRGHEYQWNGSIFYLPCPTNIKIDNLDIQTNLLIQMCSMDYDSKFTGVWDGQKMTVKDGDIQIPADLQKYIQRPISTVEIKPEYWEKFENDIVIKEFRFDKDTLKANETYYLQGEIVEIRNKIPVMKVIINNNR